MFARDPDAPSAAIERASPSETLLRGAIATLMLALAAGTGWSLATPPTPYPGLAGAVSDRLHLSGVENPVTAVLLNFRAYDTLLEIGVLALTAMAAMMLRADQLDAPIHVTREAPVHGVLTQVLTPMMLVTAGFLLWAGTTASGGAFQSGAVLGAAGILLLLAGVAHDAVRDGWLSRAVAAGGFALFMLAGMAMLWLEGRMLAYPQEWAYTLIFVIEAVLALSIGGCLALFYGIGAKEAQVPGAAAGADKPGDNRVE